MKTNKFENTIRRKLESIQPDFQEQDWAKMQQYMQVHTPPTFWQQYGSWVGYAAAASVSTVMAFLYVNQLSQNDHLVADVKHLKNQIEVIQNQPAPATKTDTIYLVQKSAVAEEDEVSTQANSIEFAAKIGEGKNDIAYNAKKPATSLSAAAINKSIRDHDRVEVIHASPTAEYFTKSVSQTAPENTGSKPFQSGNQGNLSAGSAQRVLGNEFVMISAKSGAELNNGYSMSLKMNYDLASRISSRQVQKSLYPAIPQSATSNLQIARTQVASAPASNKKVEQTTKTENVIPKLNIKVPYRFGGGIVIEGNGVAKTVVGEVLVAKKFSITAGINWLKIKPMEFFTEKIFREKNRQDFKRSHPGEVPLAFDVYNIKVNPTMVQIPLTVAFRNTIKDNWAYYAGVGTNINVSSKEKVSFDCRAPNNEFFSQGFEKKTSLPAISSVNFSMGLEKSWHPIVVQAEGYLYTYFRPLTPLSHSAGPGVKVKLLYQIGGKM